MKLTMQLKYIKNISTKNNYIKNNYIKITNIIPYLIKKFYCKRGQLLHSKFNNEFKRNADMNFI